MEISKKGPAFYVILVLTVLLGLTISVLPFPVDYEYLRPEVLCLLVLFWMISDPDHLGIIFAWTVGLLQDVVEGSVWGAHALALTALALICQMSYQRIKNYSVWHQTLWVYILVGFHQVVVNWVQGMAGYDSRASWLLVSTTTSALTWPLLYLLVQRVRFAYRLH